MKDKLEKLLNNSYSPYSKFQVASIVVTNDNNEYPGVNVESASFSTTICAERNAIHNAIASGAKSGSIKEIHLMAKNQNDSEANQFVSPCGSCRQVIAEQSNNNAKVFMYKSNGEVKEEKISDLIPDAFLGENIG